MSSSNRSLLGRGVLPCDELGRGMFHGLVVVKPPQNNSLFATLENSSAMIVKLSAPSAADLSALLLTRLSGCAI